MAVVTVIFRVILAIACFSAGAHAAKPRRYARGRLAAMQNNTRTVEALQTGDRVGDVAPPGSLTPGDNRTAVANMTMEDVPSSVAQVDMPNGPLLDAPPSGANGPTQPEDVVTTESTQPQTSQSGVAAWLSIPYDNYRFLTHASPVSGHSFIIPGLVWMSFTIIYAAIYRAYINYEYPSFAKPQVSTTDFSFGLCAGCDCKPDFRICVCSFCCISVRWADTVSNDKLGFVGFWRGFLCFLVLAWIPWLWSWCFAWIAWIGLLVFGCGVPLLGTLGRQRIRTTYDIPGSIIKDCLIWWCCSYCATMQEALQVEFISPSSTRGGVQTS